MRGSDGERSRDVTQTVGKLCSKPCHGNVTHTRNVWGQGQGQADELTWSMPNVPNVLLKGFSLPLQRWPLHQKPAEHERQMRQVARGLPPAWTMYTAEQQ